MDRRFRPILALNAAVEAGAGGRARQGFAVVAAQVRALLALAQADAARQIKTLITSSLEQMESGARAGARCRPSACSASCAMRNTSTAWWGASPTKPRKQSQGMAQLHTTMVALDGMTQDNARPVQASSQAAASLHAQAGHLAEQVAVFKLQDANKRYSLKRMCIKR